MELSSLRIFKTVAEEGGVTGVSIEAVAARAGVGVGRVDRAGLDAARGEVDLQQPLEPSRPLSGVRAELLVVGEQLGEQGIAGYVGHAQVRVQGLGQVGFEALGITRSCTDRQASVKALATDACLCVVAAGGVFPDWHGARSLFQAFTAARS